MTNVISTGAEFERYDESGRLVDPDAETMARAAFRGKRDEWTVPQRVWIKEFPGQVTDGRIGRPAIRYAPLSWLPARLGEEVRALASHGGQHDR